MQALARAATAGCLESLTLHSCGTLGDGSVLADLRAMTALSLTWSTGLSSHGLMGCTQQLTSLELLGCEAVDDDVCKSEYHNLPNLGWNLRKKLLLISAFL